MKKKLLKILNWIVYAVGVVTLALIAVSAVFILWDSIKRSHSTAESSPEYLYRTTFDNHILTIATDKKDKDNVVMMTISGKGIKETSIPFDYEGDITESKIIPLENGSYGIVLFSGRTDCESSNEHIYFLRYGNGLKKLETLEMLDSYKPDVTNSYIYGTLDLPGHYIEGVETWGFNVPVSIRFERKSISVTPLITNEGIDAIKKIIGRKRERIIKKLTQEGKKEDLKEYMEAEQKVKDALAPRTIKF